MAHFSQLEVAFFNAGEQLAELGVTEPEEDRRKWWRWLFWPAREQWSELVVPYPRIELDDYASYELVLDSYEMAA